MSVFLTLIFGGYFDRTLMGWKQISTISPGICMILHQLYNTHTGSDLYSVVRNSNGLNCGGLATYGAV